MSNKWYVLQVFTAQEKKVKKALQEYAGSADMADLIEEIMIPTENVMEGKQGEQKITEKRIWLGYGLIKMNLTDESWK